MAHLMLLRLTRVPDDEEVNYDPDHLYEVGDDIWATWTDGDRYPATIKRVLDDGTYAVLYCDGDYDPQVSKET